MLKHIYFIYGLMLIAVLNCAQGSINIVNLSCTSFDETAVVFEACDLPKIRQTNLTAISVHVNLLKPMHNVTVHLIINKVNDSKSSKLIEFKSDICAFMKNKRRNPLAGLMYTAIGFDKYSNMNHACPYMGKVYIKIPGFSDRMIKLLGIPNGNYVFNLKYLLNLKTRVNVISILEKTDENN